uniref:ATP-dependent RNA helicase-related protein, putative n=1 Tax=Theileria annulata TaxID=5874 RepID=A0A3B0MHH6_THEAN
MERVIEKYKNQIVHSVEEYNVLVLSGYPDSYMYSFVPFYLFNRGFTDQVKQTPNPPKICTVFNNKQDVLYFSDLCSALVSDQSKVTTILDDNSNYNKKSEIVYTTDEYIIRKLLVDPLLSEFSVFVLCNLQERPINMDVLLALFKRLLNVRKRLRLVLLYQSTNVNYILEYFKRETSNESNEPDNVPTPDFCLGEFPLKDVQYIYLENEFSFYKVNYLSRPTSNYLETLISTVYDICKNESSDNILIFVPTREHAHLLKAELEEIANQFSSDKGIINVMCLRANIYMEEKENVLRNIFICTDVNDYNFGMGEITYLVDSCLTRRLSSEYLNTGMSENITPSTREEMMIKSSLIHNVRRGLCYRLMTQDDYNSIVQEFIVPEIMTKDLTLMVLLLKSLGISKLSDFDFLTKPPAESLKHSLFTLYMLGAIDASGELVYPIGNLMAELRVTPYLSSFLYRSVESGCSEEALIIYSMLQVKEILWKKSCKIYRNESSYHTDRLESAKLAFAALEGDLVSYFNMFQLSQYYKDEDDRWLSVHMVNERAIQLAEKIKTKTTKLLAKYDLETNSCDGNVELLIKTIFSSFFLNVACKEYLVQNFQNSNQIISHLKDNKPLHVSDPKIEDQQPYVLVKSYQKFNYKPLYIHPSSFIVNEQPDWVVFNESNTIDGKLYMHDVTTIRPEYLQELAPHYFGECDVKPYLEIC